MSEDPYKVGYRNGYDAAMSQATGAIKGAQSLYERQSKELDIVLRCIEQLRITS